MSQNRCVGTHDARTPPYARRQATACANVQQPDAHGCCATQNLPAGARRAERARATAIHVVAARPAQQERQRPCHLAADPAGKSTAAQTTPFARLRTAAERPRLRPHSRWTPSAPIGRRRCTLMQRASIEDTLIARKCLQNNGSRLSAGGVARGSLRRSLLRIFGATGKRGGQGLQLKSLASQRTQTPRCQ